LASFHALRYASAAVATLICYDASAIDADVFQIIFRHMPCRYLSMPPLSRRYATAMLLRAAMPAD